MTREEAEALLERVVSEMRMSSGGKTAVLHLPPMDFAKLLELARLGASVAAPTNPELIAAVSAMVEADDKQTGYHRCEHMLRAALSALQEPASEE